MEHNIPLSSMIQALQVVFFPYFSSMQGVFVGFLIFCYSFIPMSSQMTVSMGFDSL